MYKILLFVPKYFKAIITLYFIFVMMASKYVGFISLVPDKYVIFITNINQND